MTDRPTFRLSRRKVLAGLGTIGIASAGAGLGTTAFLSDEEQVSAELEAGQLNLKLDYRATYTPGNRPDFADRSQDRIPGTDRYVLKQVPDLRDPDDDLPLSEEDWGRTVRMVPCSITGLVDGQNGDDGMMFDLRDVKPKDEGEVTLSMHLCDNPAYLWVRTLKSGDVDGPADGSLPAIVEPEDMADGTYDGTDGTDDGDLDDYMYVEVWYDRDCDNVHSDDVEDGEVYLYRGSMAGFLELGAGGIPLDFGADTECEILADPAQATPFPTSTEPPTPLATEPGGVHCIALRWYLPCYAVQEDGNGFTQLDSCFVPDGEGGYTTGSLADELLARGVLSDIADLDVNVVQTDGLGFGLDVAATQSRHNMANANPFGPTVESLDTLVLERTLDPKATYLHTNNDSGATDAVPLDLGANGIAPGDTVRIEQVGAFKPGSGTTHTDSNVKTTAVFSSSSTLAGSGQAHRVPGAIDAGTDFTSAATWYGSETTDIPEDFRVDPSVVVTVPAGATHLFVAAHDSHYGDNTDPNGDYGISIYR